MKKQQLEVEPDLDFLLLGLVSSQKASKIGFYLNQAASLNLERMSDFMLPDYNPQANTSFSRFSFSDEENHLDYSLLANKEFGLCLINELKQFDFLMIIRGGIEFFDAALFITDCRNINDILHVALIENEKLKSGLSWVV
ncbi:MAG: IPExxxVDY family protein [Bacteroidia bacterium]|nr:IPExxxVDY family protein [Bacteroidia bacterium]